MFEYPITFFITLTAGFVKEVPISEKKIQELKFFEVIKYLKEFIFTKKLDFYS